MITYKTRTDVQNIDTEHMMNEPANLSDEQTSNPERWSALPLEELSERPNGDTRALNISHVFELATSIEQVGLIEPIVVDLDGHLLAGGHRLAALKLLNPHTRSEMVQELLRRAQQEVGEQGISNVHRSLDELREGLPAEPSFDFDHVPVRVFNFSAHDEPNRALEVEISENAQRRNYSPAEVLSLYQVLLTKGYTDSPGRPKASERAVKPKIASLIGQSVRTVRRKLEQAQRAEVASESELMRGQALKVIKSVQRLRKALENLEPEVAYAVRSSIEWASAHEGLLGALEGVERAEEPEICVADHLSFDESDSHD